MLVYQRVHSLKKKGEKKGVNWGRKLLQSEAVNPRNPKWGRVGWHGAHQNQVSEFECHPPLDPQYDDHVQIGSPGNRNFCKWSHLEIHISGRVAGPNRNHGPFPRASCSRPMSPMDLQWLHCQTHQVCTNLVRCSAHQQVPPSGFEYLISGQWSPSLFDIDICQRTHGSACCCWSTP